MSRCVLSRFSHVWLFATPWTIACQVPQSMGFSRQEYWSGLPFPSPNEKVAIHKLADSISANIFILDFLASGNVRTKCLLFKLPSLCSLILSAQTKTGRQVVVFQYSQFLFLLWAGRQNGGNVGLWGLIMCSDIHHLQTLDKLPSEASDSAPVHWALEQWLHFLLKMK